MSKFKHSKIKKRKLVLIRSKEDCPPSFTHFEYITFHVLESTFFNRLVVFLNILCNTEKNTDSTKILTILATQGFTLKHTIMQMKTAS